MGANSSHEPLDKNTAFKRHASLRGTKGEKRSSPRRMERLRRSFRDSFRRRKDHFPEPAKPHVWQSDEDSVKAGTCTFHVKYLGCVEVFESRGMPICEEALKVLRNSRRRPIKAVLFVSGDGLRVVEDETKGLIVDQTIEKVSFCAPDRNHEKGFSYICRDGTTRRWMCHGFLALKDSGERLSHAVGCAFAACLERKQRREKELGVTMTFDTSNSTFTRQGSFRQTTLTEKLTNERNIAVPTTTAPPPPTTVTTITTSNSTALICSTSTTTPSSVVATTTTTAPISASTNPKVPPPNPHAIERPHATPSMLLRQGSFRGFQQPLTSPFKRQLSLHLPRGRSMSLDTASDANPHPLIQLKTPEVSISTDETSSGRLRLYSMLNKTFTEETKPPNRLRLYSLPTKVLMSPIPETSPLADKHGTDPVSAMCQQLSQGLQMLSNADDLQTENPVSNGGSISDIFPKSLSNIFSSNDSSVNNSLTNNFLAQIESLKYNNLKNNNNHSRNGTSIQQENKKFSITMESESRILTPPITPPPLSESPIPVLSDLPKPDQWLGKVEQVASRRVPSLVHMRTHSVDTYFHNDTLPWTAASSISKIQEESATSLPAQPPQPPPRNTNPFLSNSNNSTPVKAFEVQL